MTGVSFHPSFAVNHTTFSALGLPEPLLAAVEQLGYEEPSHIQAASIPLALEGKDLIGLSETGSGKTPPSASPVSPGSTGKIPIPRCS